MKFVMYPHGGSGNHGCEAIVRGTARLLDLEKSLGYGGSYADITNCALTLFSDNVEEDHCAGLQDVCIVKQARTDIRVGSMAHLKAMFRARVLGYGDAYDELIFSDVVECARKADYFLSIGGDNYCYGKPAYIYLVNRMLDKLGVRRILWGASVEPTAIDDAMLADLRGYHKIWARESLTYEALLEKGLKQTFLLPDPAFVLGRKDLPLPDGFVEGNTVGVNVSPMIIGNEKNEGVALQNYVMLVKEIIERTDMQIALIPHVVWSHNDDRIPLRTLYERFKDTGRVVMLDDHNAEELKGCIARCRFMVVARTHASIAAYSTNVPTLVVGYSVKARGIARDIFGDEEHYVLPVQSLTREDDLWNAFVWIMKHEKDIRAHYEGMMSDYIGRVYKCKEYIKG